MTFGPQTAGTDTLTNAAAAKTTAALHRDMVAMEQVPVGTEKVVSTATVAAAAAAAEQVETPEQQPSPSIVRSHVRATGGRCC